MFLSKKFLSFAPFLTSFRFIFCFLSLLYVARHTPMAGAQSKSPILQMAS